MASNMNTKIFNKWIREGLNGGNIELADAIFAQKFVGHLPSIEIPEGPEGIKQMAEKLRCAFPDLKVEAKITVAENNYVAYYGNITGTHKGDAFQVPATGKKINYSFSGIDRFEDNKIVERWELVDTLSMLRQLGVIQR